MRVGIFGSAFNPITNGHIDAIEQALKQFDHVIAVPSYSHAFGKMMKPYEFRLKLTEVALTKHFGERVSVSNVEKRIYCSAPVYTWQVMTQLDKELPSDTITFICGTDNIEQFCKFQKSELIKSRWGVYEVRERSPIRSTLVRAKSEKGSCIDGLVPSIIKHEIETEYRT